MANLFSSIFNRTLNVNVYNNSVSKPITFNDLSFTQLEALYITLPDVRIIEDFVSDNIAKIPVLVVDSKDNEIENTPLNNLIDQTNLTQSWAEFVKEVFVSFGLTGNMFVKRNPDTGMLYVLPTSNTYINLAAAKSLPEFMNYIASYSLQLGGQNYPIEERDMFHLKSATLSSENGLWTLGTSPYQSGTKNVTTLEATYSSRVSVISKRGAMGFITNESEHPDETQTQLVKDALETYGTKEEQQKIAVTTQRLRYNQMALGVAELQLLENLDHDFNTLCKLRGLHPILFNSQGTTYANQQEARKAAINNVIIPLADKFYNKFNEYIRPFYGGLRIMPQYETLSEYGVINTELSTKILNEVKAGLLTPEQAMEILYPDLEYIEPEPEIINTEENGNIE